MYRSTIWKVAAEEFSQLIKDTNSQVQEALQIKRNKCKTPRSIIEKLKIYQRKKRFKIKQTKIILNKVLAGMAADSYISNMLKENNCQPRILYPV